MKDHEIQIDDETSSLLGAIAQARDDPFSIAELAQIDPTEFRQFISQCGEADTSDANQLLNAAELIQRGRVERKSVLDNRRDKKDSVSTRLPFPKTIMQRMAPFRVMLMLNLGLVVSLIYGLVCSTFLWYFSSKVDAQLFFASYTNAFKTFISLGLIIGTALAVYTTQNLIPRTIEAAFRGQLSNQYYSHKRRFASLRISVTFSAEFTAVAFIIFSYCQFPLSKPGESLMLVAACAEYALGAYVFHKLIYIGMMLHSLTTTPVTRNLFRHRELDAINGYVQLVSTLAIICICVHVIVYYRGPFLYGSILGQSIKTFLLLPALIATPALLMLSLYPRAVLQKLYEKSIDVEIKRLKKALRNAELSAYEKRSYLNESDKNYRDELRYSMKLKLRDFPMGVAEVSNAIGGSLRSSVESKRTRIR